MQRIYLDHAATTPIDPKVREAMDAYLDYEFGNPSALYQEGLVARQAIDTARSAIARTLNAHNDELVFTGSGTESDNLAVQGVVLSYQREHPGVVPHIITSQIEHPAVLHTVQTLEKRGSIEATYVSVDAHGRVDPKEINESLRDSTVLVSIMHANSEIGTVQDIREIAKVVRDFRKTKGVGKDSVGYPYVHTDACQAFNYEESNVQKLGVDLYTFNGSKIYGPKGVGALFVRRGVAIEPLVCGGSQELGLRAGTENVAAIVGMGVAASIAHDMRESEGDRLQELRDFFIDALLKAIPGSKLNGARDSRLPNNVNISMPGVEQDMVVIELDAKGIACSSKSACKSSDAHESHVVKALGKKGEALNTVRFTLGRSTTKEDLESTISALQAFLAKMQKLNK